MKEISNLSIEIEIRSDAILSEGNLRKIIKRIRNELKEVQESPQVKIILK